MEDTNTQEVKTSRSRLVDRYSKKFPDKKWEGEGAESDENLYGYAADDLDQLEQESEARKSVDDKIRGLFKNDRRSAKAFLRMSDGDNPMEAILDEYGQDALDYLQSDEGKEAVKKKNQEWADSELKNKEAQEAYDKNMDKSVSDLLAFVDSHKISDEDAVKVVGSLYEWAENIVNGKITPEMLEASFKAGKYDSDVAEAREEGEINGRNARIKSQLREEKKGVSKMPPTVGSSNGNEPEAVNAQPKTGALSMFGGIPVRRKG